MVCVEATAVTAQGRISPGDLGIWNDRHVEQLARIARFVTAHGAAPAIQLAHAGRKASSQVPWAGGRPLFDKDGAWLSVGPSPIPFDSSWPAPTSLDESGISDIVKAFADGARRARAAGFAIIEVHAAHGYLLHSFLSPISNRRDDRWGGSFANRSRLVVEVVRAVRSEWPEDRPLFVRLSCTDWVDGGWDIEQSIELARVLRGESVDLIDCSSGGSVPHARIPVSPGYQVPFAARIRREAEIATAAVGMISRPGQADNIISNGDADLVLMAREFLRDPYWPLHHASDLGSTAVKAPVQYGRAFA